jgi:methylase of polypeptide subunit release factors
MSKISGPLQFTVSEAVRFRDLLRDLNYTPSGIADILCQGKGKSETSQHATSQLSATLSHSPLETLLRLFLLHQPVDVELVRKTVEETDLYYWVRMGLIRIDQGTVFPLIHIFPYAQMLLVSDHQRYGGSSAAQFPSLHEETTPVEAADFVMGLNATCLQLANATIRRPNESFLDLGSGCGIQSFLAAKHSRSVLGVDCNPRAISVARFNTILNQIENVGFQQADMQRAGLSEKFDFVVSNPPFVIQPGFRAFYRDNGCAADNFCRTLVHNTPFLLQEQGVFQMVFDWAHVKGQPWQQRLSAWCEESGCDAWVMRWETKDISEYAQHWNRAWKNEAAFADIYQRWMTWYAEQGIEAVSSGMITMRKISTRPNWFRADDAPGDFNTSVGDDVQQLFESTEWLQASDEELLNTCFKLHPAVCLDQKLQQASGTWEIASANLRRREGIPYQGEVDSLTANLLPECDGSATYGDLLLSLAANNHRTVAEITPVYLDVLRRLLRRGFLLAEEPTEATPLHGIHAANEMTNGSLQPVAALTN